MGIFNTIGSLTYKTQRILTKTFADPVNDLKQGYTMAKQKQNLADAKTKAIYENGSSKATGYNFRRPERHTSQLRARRCTRGRMHVRVAAADV